MEREFTAHAAPDEVRAAVLSTVIRRGGVVTTQTPDSITATFTHGPNLLVALVLSFFFVVPAIVYLLFWRKTDTLAAVMRPGSGGGTAVVVMARGKAAEKAGIGILASFGETLTRKALSAAGSGAAIAARKAGEAASQAADYAREHAPEWKEQLMALQPGAGNGDGHPSHGTHTPDALAKQEKMVEGALRGALGEDGDPDPIEIDTSSVERALADAARIEAMADDEFAAGHLVCRDEQGRFTSCDEDLAAVDLKDADKK
jgi:hypothetical protein